MRDHLRITFLATFLSLWFVSPAETHAASVRASAIANLSAFSLTGATTSAAPTIVNLANNAVFSGSLTATGGVLDPPQAIAGALAPLPPQNSFVVSGNTNSAFGRADGLYAGGALFTSGTMDMLGETNVTTLGQDGQGRDQYIITGPLSGTIGTPVTLSFDNIVSLDAFSDFALGEAVASYEIQATLIMGISADVAAATLTVTNNGTADETGLSLLDPGHFSPGGTLTLTATPSLIANGSFSILVAVNAQANGGELIPEPTTGMLTLFGLGLIALRKRRRRR